MENPKRRASRGLLLYRALRALSFVVRRLPLPLARGIGLFLGHLGWHLLRRDRRRALDNITIAFPEWSRRCRRATIRAMFHHLGMCLTEILWLPNLDAETLARTTTIEDADRVRGRSGGVIAITGHCGNWEWLAQAIASIAPPLTVLQRERDEPELNRFITELRGRSGIETIDRGSTGAGRVMIRALRRGSVLAFLIDQNIRTESVKVPFFGRPALTPIGPARLAIRTGVPVVCMFIERAGRRQQIRVLEPIVTSQDDDPVALTALLTAQVEAQIRRRPEQWVWMHDRWRERPQWDVSTLFEVK